MEIALIPESAPFTVEQRAWLNGFLSGWIGLAGAATQGAALAKAILAGPAAAEPPPPSEPWHDPALALDDRLQLADGQPPARRLMAAMAQLDCGACGYLCRTYAEAIAVGTELANMVVVDRSITRSRTCSIKWMRTTSRALEPPPIARCGRPRYTRRRSCNGSSNSTPRTRSKR